MEIVKGVAFWASVHKPNKTFDENGIYQIDLEVDKTTQKKLKDLGLNLILKDDGRVIFRPKRKVLRKDGGINKGPDVYDKFGKLMSDDIGNGSEVEVAFNIFPYGRIKGNGADLCKIKVNNLVEYRRDENPFEFEQSPEDADNPFKD